LGALGEEGVDEKIRDLGPEVENGAPLQPKKRGKRKRTD